MSAPTNLNALPVHCILCGRTDDTGKWVALAGDTRTTLRRVSPVVSARLARTVARSQDTEMGGPAHDVCPGREVL